VQVGNYLEQLERDVINVNPQETGWGSPNTGIDAAPAGWATRGLKRITMDLLKKDILCELPLHEL